MSDAQPPVDPKVEQDPAVIQEEVRLRVRMLRLKYYQEVFKTIAAGIQTFKTEAVSLMSGLGTLVLGWYQLRKWVLVGRKEVKELRAVEHAQPVAPRAEARAGGGSGRHTPRPTATATAVPAPAPEAVGLAEPTMFTDGATYAWFAFIAAFLVSSVMTWLKRKRKAAEDAKTN